MAGAKAEENPGSPECVFCGSLADTKEHVIPKWLQNHFDLANNRLLLSNGTLLSYRQAVVPACLRCNGPRFSPLEQRIRENRASKRDYFIWALKITYGLAHRDASLPMDRANPESGPLVPLAVADDTGHLVRHAFRALDDPSFRFVPDPFGSVMLLDSGQDDFVLVDVPRPYRAVAVALPNHRHLIVLPGDRGVLASLHRKHPKLRASIGMETPAVSSQQQVAMKIFGLLILRCHLDVPTGVELAVNGLLAEPIPRRLRTFPQPLETYRSIAAMLALPQGVADAAYLQFASRFETRKELKWK